MDERDLPHGTAGCYSNWGCRRQECRQAWAALQKRMREQRYAELGDPRFPQPEHGKASTYYNWGCKCDRCVAAKRSQVQRAKIRRARQAA
jgi:hypothetical protein